MEIFARKMDHCILLVSLLSLFTFRVCFADGLVQNFYSVSCPHAEELVRNITWSKVQNNLDLAAKLLRLHYHDCFVRGCDASILLDSDGANQTEKNAVPNLSLSGYTDIDDIKAEIEKICPGIVSCADILALAARDGVSFFFQRPMWNVLTGRRDGTVSPASIVTRDFPSPNANFTTLKQQFENKGLDVGDLVSLSGAHTIGVANCGSISRRLYNFTGRGDTDPSLDPTYAQSLKRRCPIPIDSLVTLQMDPQSSLSFDSHYFDILKQNKGLFTSDAALLTNDDSALTVTKLQNQDSFFSSFANSMMKMGAIEVLTGNAGQVRSECRVVNN